MHKTATNLIWLIQKNELGKFILMAALMFCILFNHSMINSLKEGLVVPNLGAEAVSFIELYGVLPAVFLFMLSYLKLSSHIADKDKLFYIISCFFLVFFTLFAFILYPNIENIRPNHITIHNLIIKFPNLKWFLIIYENWPLALFNIFSDLWAGTMLSLLFWQYVNSVTSIDQAKRFYPLLSFIGNFSMIGSGMATKYILHQTISNDNSIQAIKLLTILIIIFGILSMLLFSYMYNIYNFSKRIIKKSKKQLVSFKESIHLISKSRYLWYIAVIVISYGLVINLSLGLWKAEIRKIYTSTEQYMLYMSEYHKWSGISNIIAILISSYMVRKLSWIVVASTAPIIILVTGSIFFTWIIIDNTHISIGLEHYLYLSVLISTVYIILAKTAKISLFDPTKELTYIPLKEDLRDKGKAAIDLLGERIGKSGGSSLQVAIFTVFPHLNYFNLAPLFAIICLITIICWLWAIKQLNKEYLDIQKE